jgi:hypothetical protein
MSDWKQVSHNDFAAYLRRVGSDYRDSGREATAEDYEEAARRIAAISKPQVDWERITAADVRVGDLIASTRNDEPSQVTGLDAAGERSRYIDTSRGRIRPRHTTKLWRVVSS